MERVASVLIIIDAWYKHEDCGKEILEQYFFSE